MTNGEWSLPAVLDVVTEAVPDREMLVWSTVRRTYAEVADRSRRLAAFLRQRGLGARRERFELARWECGQSPVALVLPNCPEYLEAMIGAYRARAVPFNVNHHYRPGEVAALLGGIRAEAVVYRRALGPLLADRAGLGDCLLLDIDDGSGVAPLPGSTPYEEAIATATGVDDLPVPSPDDLHMVCTGGTTGAPKGVLWRQADALVGAMSGGEGATRADIAAVARAGTGVWFATPPLMHGTAQWTAFAGITKGATVVLHDDTGPFDARTILEIAQRERVNIMTIVGDAYARPLVDELRARHYDLTSLASLGSGGAATSPGIRQALLDLLPQVAFSDGYGASESGPIAFASSTSATTQGRFMLAPRSAVLAADRSRFLRPGDEEIGWLARTGRVPLGYLHDPERTRRTFPIVAGQRVAVPGDRARYASDSQIVMLGRDSMVINTGGEKVFVEEVEEALRLHPDVVDALVVGRPSDRFGEEVVALVQLRPGAELSPLEVREFAAGSVARFKAPRAVLVCDRIRRHATGKPDYRWARQAALDATPAAGTARR
ncbi:AMP-binding protein [Frankia sp. CNm7]|uniref:AMP-binding protein n=1 Tax=Frankia nepalensis TaxID=1836974 RepID=A0A937RTK4_9ACTN|nr:AMP-binding protein [Frankia nepalensis]MBL7500214.1 AMP-binding protein [Frankia nepalensis]MBL7514611.1 AMP-binding protein [Frankia nepalensis]MBL7524303.1 AMP-binding protein [Frankia nepalensis]MBL7631676.1 AMP-binding protein [Frankia nepalensis]